VDNDGAWYAYLVRDAHVIFDIGANVGWTALLACVYGRPNRIVLVDPNPMALTFAAGNLAMNDFAENCVFVKRFISDKPGDKVKFFTVGPGAAGSMFAVHAKTASSLASWFWVSTTTVDELSSRLKLVPDLIKIDVEGAEHLVLLGAAKVAQKGNPKIFVEVHSNSELSMEDNCRRILNWAATNGYAVWYLTDGTQITTPDHIKHRGRCHVLLLKEGIGYPEDLRSINQGAELPPIVET
jgi:FkbM family methyltransferase